MVSQYSGFFSQLPASTCLSSLDNPSNLTGGYTNTTSGALHFRVSYVRSSLASSLFPFSHPSFSLPLSFLLSPCFIIPLLNLPIQPADSMTPDIQYENSFRTIFIYH